ncbi:hypothetical protein BGZ95_008114 [Linnemannia exigua]|uniref:Uncharacterized protein n=1 Tax=Linnemannia exigua TaxID=604196 RepID=A0AAD4DEG0_9FUNG|nr:hypothetical protein BGZ95_008114 [Linnemannia exigua]
MLIPPSEEFDPGTRQNCNEQAAMSGKNNMATSLEASPPPLVPHRYQYPIDVPRIHRLLRPLKAKVKAIQLAIKSAPSYGYTSATTTNHNNNNSNNTNNNWTTPTSRTSRQERYFNRNGPSLSRDEGESSSRPRRERANRYYGRLNPSSAPSHNGDNTTATPNASVKSGRDLLISRFQHSLTDVFRELIDKNWWQPICDDYDLPLDSSLSKVLSKGIKPNEYTLGMSCAFAVGRFVAGLSEDEEDLVDRYYHVMPESMRRFALLEHSALRILEHLLLNQDDNFQLDYRWAYIVASRVASADSWVQTWAQKAPVSFFTSRQFSAITLQLPHHGATLIQASIKIHMYRATSGISENTRRVRSIKFATSLIKESLKLHERLAEGHDSMLLTTGLSRHEKYDGEIERLAKSLFEEHEMEPASWKKGVALALALHSLYAIVTTSPESAMAYEGMGSWVELINRRAGVGICARDFDVVVQAYGTLTNLNSLVLMLDAVGLYSMAITLIDVMLEEFYVLEDATCRNLGDSCDVTIQSLESLKKEVGLRRIQHDHEFGWVYDEVMETWVEMTPKTNKIISLPVGSLIETDRDDSEDEEQGNYPTTPTRRRSNFGSTSRDAFSDSGQHNPNNPTTSPTQDSPFVMRRPIRYSMTPMRRSSRPRRRLGRYGEDVSEPESGQNDDEGVYVAPVDLEFYARYAIEDDSDSEVQPQHELRPLFGSDSEDNFSENTAPNSLGSRSSTASSGSDLEYDNGSPGEDALQGNDEVTSENESECEVVARPSRRQVEEDNYRPLSPIVVVLSDNTSSEGDKSFGRADSDTSIASDDDNQHINSDSSESVMRAAVRMSRRRQEFESVIEYEGEGAPGDVDGVDVFVISDDDDESGRESADEASQESDPQPKHRKRPNLQRHVLSTPESEPDADSSSEHDEPILQRKSTRRIQSCRNVARQEQYQSPSPPPSPPQDSSVAPSRIRLRKMRPQSYVLSTGEGSLSDDSVESDYLESITKERLRLRTSRFSRPSTSQPQPKPASRQLRVTPKLKACQTSNGHRVIEESPDNRETPDSVGLPYRSVPKSNTRSRFAYDRRSKSSSHTSKNTMVGHRTPIRRKRPIVYDDDDNNSDNNSYDNIGENMDNRLIVSSMSEVEADSFHSTPRSRKSQEKRQPLGSIRVSPESSGSDSPPRTRPRKRTSPNQPRARKRIRIDDGDDSSDNPDKYSDLDFHAPPQEVSKRLKESHGVSSKPKSVVVAEDSLDDMEDFQQEPGRRARIWTNSTTTYSKKKPWSSSSSSSAPSHRPNKAILPEERLFWL